MKRTPFTALGALATLLLSASACQPDQPATQPPAAAPPAATSSPASPPAPGAGGDTLHLPDGRVVQLRAIPADTFYRLPFSGLPELVNEPTAEHLPAEQGRLTRQGRTLRLQPAQGAEVRLVSAPEAQLARQNGEGVRYLYWGSLPAAHQWAVRAWASEVSTTVLVDQRTGHQLAALPGAPVAAPDGHLVLFISPGLGGSEQPNMLSLVQVTAGGARLRWQIEPTTWEPVEARWVASGRVVLKRRHTLPDGRMADDARVTYDELMLPR